jgi:MarR family transcriptional regulator, lower aerobic nicotinate degradation pathway regulator
MGNRYKILKQLIDLWESYEEKEQELNLLDFADWMRIKLRKSPHINRKSSYNNSKIEQPGLLAYFKSLDEPTQFLEVISRISRYHEFYIRKFLVDLPINNRLEYLFLNTVRQMHQAKKTDLINIHLVDYSTGMDTIKRLINNGFLTEASDKNDKRVRLLEMTEKGLGILLQADKKVSDERNMFLSCISMNKWKKAMPVLDEINNLHNSIYLKHNDKPYAELINLMDSLKHLHR